MKINHGLIVYNVTKNVCLVLRDFDRLFRKHARNMDVEHYLIICVVRRHLVNDVAFVFNVRFVQL